MIKISSIWNWDYLLNRRLLVQSQQWKYQDNVWNLFKVNIKDTKWRHWRRSSVFIANFKQISHIDLKFPMSTLNKWIPVALPLNKFFWFFSKTNSWNVTLKTAVLLSAQFCISYGNQLFDLLCKSNDWFLYEKQH